MNIQINEQTVVVFDLDDTLYNELDYLISAYKEIARFVDVENEKIVFSIMFSMYRKKENVFNYLIDTYKVEKQELIFIYRNHFPLIKLKKGVKQIFKLIKQQQGKIAIITDGRSVTQRNKIKALKISKYLDFISISEEINAEKPSSKAFELVMNNVRGKTYYYIADNLKKDFISPKKLNWKTIAVLDNGKNIHVNEFQYYKNIEDVNFLVYDINEINIQ